MMIKNKTGLFDIINISLMLVLLAIFIYPFLYMMSISVSDTFAIARGEVFLYPKVLGQRGDRRGNPRRS